MLNPVVRLDSAVIGYGVDPRHADLLIVAGDLALGNVARTPGGGSTTRSWTQFLKTRPYLKFTIMTSTGLRAAPSSPVDPRDPIP